MDFVMSRDGTRVAFTRRGAGTPVVLLGGTLDDGAENEPLAAALASSFTVVNLQRRGRGASGDTHPHTLEREIEDVAAVIAAHGGTAHVFGVSSGGALALEAAAAGVPVDRLAVYEVPYSVGDHAMEEWEEYLEDLVTALAENRRGDAVARFMQLAGSRPDQISAARDDPSWPALEALAHTLAYDAACLGNGLPPEARLATIRRPTLVLTGGGIDPHLDGLPRNFFDDAADAIAAAIPGARRVRLDGQSHVADPAVIAPVLERFLAGDPTTRDVSG